ncbi:MAG: molybdopterin-guanine dinucleotide biosynthesis protein MobB, partial [Elusimicrobiota bacterium]
KTTLAISIARLLKKRGHSVAVIKNSSTPVNHGNRDTGRFMKEISQVAIITPENSEIIFGDSRNLQEIIQYFSADFLILEGFKNLKYFPKIICLRKEDKIEELDDGLTLFAVGMDNSLKEKSVIDYLITDKKDLEKIVEQVEKNAFILPDMNCGKCGYQDCYRLAMEIVKETASQKRCIYFQNSIFLYINKKRVYLNPFMSKLYQNMFYGMLSPLKDVDSLENACVEIKLSTIGELKKKN